MIQLGNYNTLRILRHTDPGIYLEGDETTGDILLPKRYVTNEMHDGDEVQVFVYLDQEERIIATTETPLAKVNGFACLEVAWTNQYGAFLNWGLMKDLFCPFREQKQRMQRGKRYIVYIKEDEASHRLMATAKVEKYLHPATVSIILSTASVFAVIWGCWLLNEHYSLLNLIGCAIIFAAVVLVQLPSRSNGAEQPHAA